MSKSNWAKNVQTLFDYLPPQMVNLAMGAPTEDMLKKCTEIAKTATAHRMDQDDAHHLFQYGPERGDKRYREVVAKFLTEEYQAPVDANDIVATSGATQALHLISHVLFDPGDIVFVENPTYFIATKIFQLDAGLKLKTVPMDDDGIIPDELEKVIEANKDYRPRELTERKPYWGILYTLTSFQNPRGMCLPPDRCRRVIELARKYKLLVVCDDVYNLLYFGDKPPVRLFSYDNKDDTDYLGNVISNCTFSKIFGPGLRLGWMEAPHRVRDIFLTSGLSASGGSFNHTMSGIMTSAIELGLVQNMIRENRTLYKEQCLSMCRVFKAQVPECEFTSPQGGYFVWIKLPEGLDGKALKQLCEAEYALTFCPGEITSACGDFKDCIRVSFCHYNMSEITEASTRLAQAIKFMLESRK